MRPTMREKRRKSRQDSTPTSPEFPSVSPPIPQRYSQHFAQLAPGPAGARIEPVRFEPALRRAIEHDILRRVRPRLTPENVELLIADLQEVVALAKNLC